MSKTKNNQEAANNDNEVLANRYFFVSTIGKRFNESITFNNFQIIQPLHPTLKDCIDISNKRFPHLHEVMVLSISEFTKEDWDVFSSVT